MRFEFLFKTWKVEDADELNKEGAKQEEFVEGMKTSYVEDTGV